MVKGKLYLFNPDHDLALANRDANYMAPASARGLAADLALLPMWYAGLRDYVLASSRYNLSFLEEAKKLFPDLASLATESEISFAHLQPLPWGWDPAVRNKLLKLGVASEMLPDDGRLDIIREHSNRLLAVKLLPRLATDEYFCGESHYFVQKDDIRNFVEQHTASVLKAPFSGSGKGLNWCKGRFTFHIDHWCEHVLRQQGGVVGEPLYNKAMDFSMQFYCDGGSVKFCGYSLFHTNASGAYEGNSLATDSLIEQQLSKFVFADLLKDVQAKLEKELLFYLKDAYTGYLGVDMMLCKFSEPPYYRIHPCVEINLRMTMGMVARTFYDRYVQQETVGIYRVGHFRSPGELQANHRNLSGRHPLCVEEGRIVKGYLSLVPVTPHARYAAWVVIG